MHNISLIFTRHKEFGRCNSNELYKIIEKINPEIIFEELMLSIYNEIYKEKLQTTLETNAIKRYLQDHNIEHIPVDTYDRPKHYDRDIDTMYRRILNKGPESYNYKRLIDYQTALTKQYGFDFLNSDQNDKVFEEFDLQKEQILNSINDEKLFQFASLEKEVNGKREEEILDNIYAYSKEHDFNQAILFIGSGHRSSIMKKIETRKIQNEIEINWIYLEK